MNRNQDGGGNMGKVRLEIKIEIGTEVGVGMGVEVEKYIGRRRAENSRTDFSGFDVSLTLGNVYM